MKRALRVLRMVSLGASFLSAAGHVSADDSPTQKVQAAKSANDSSAPPAAPASSARANPEQLAAVAYQKALASYAQGDVPAALNSMRESYRLSKRAELLYNLAQLEDELKMCSDSLTDYRRYLELVPQGRYRDSAEQARQRLEQECPPPPASPTAPAKKPSEPAPPSASASDTAARSDPKQTGYWTVPRVVGWSGIAAGTLTGIAALYFQLEAIEAKHELQQSYEDAVAGGPPVDMSLQDRQHRYNHLAISFGIAGGAMVTGGALLLLLSPGKPGPHPRSANVYAMPGLVGASYKQGF